MFRKTNVLSVLICALAVLLSVSCATSGARGPFHLTFFSQGQPVVSYEMVDGLYVELPEPPVREGYTFNGWWVTSDEGVVEYSQQWLSEQILDHDIEVNARWLNTSFKVTKLDWNTDGYIQDGAIFKHYLFKFHGNGDFAIYSLNTNSLLATSTLERSAFLKMHSNSVGFGSFYLRTDSFPLLYSNVYNSYSGEIDKRLGTVGVYRIGTNYATMLVQVIKIGFANTDFWRSESGTDRSPYGDFVVDAMNNKIWFFVTRDETQTTRFYCFELPKVGSGELDINTGTMTATLTEADVITWFDVPYSNYLQGACLHDGKVYSTEGMGNAANPTVIRVIDLENGIEDCVVDLQAAGFSKEAELIDYWKDGKFIYGDYKGSHSPKTAVYTITGI